MTKVISSDVLAALRVEGPGVSAPIEGLAEKTEAARQTTKLNRDIRHLQRRIQESGGTDRDAEHLLCEVLYGNAVWKPSTGPDRY